MLFRSAQFPASRSMFRAEAERNPEINFWLGPEQKLNAEFSLKYKNKQIFNVVYLVNTHNRNYRDRSTKEIEIFLR